MWIETGFRAIRMESTGERECNRVTYLREVIWEHAYLLQISSADEDSRVHCCHTPSLVSIDAQERRNHSITATLYSALAYKREVASKLYRMKTHE